MSWEKPWRKQFESLLSQLSQHFNGDISKPKSSPVTRPYAPDISYFVYPTFKGKLKERRFTVEINEFPRIVYSVFEAADNVEYLRIFVEQPSQYSLLITQEDWTHRVKKKLRLLHEFQSGSREFDKKYYLRPKSDTDKQLLKEPKFQEVINDLEPFTVVEIKKSGILWSQQLSDERQLNFSKIENYLRKTLELAGMIASR